MARTPREEYDEKLQSLIKAVENGDVSEEDADTIRSLCAAFDAEDARESLPSGLYDRRSTSHKEYRTLGSWAERLTEAAQSLTLTDTDADSINAYTTGMVKDNDGPGKAHVRNIEYALSKFYRFHDDLGVDPDDIVVHEYDNTGSNGWDERDLLEPDERAALRTVADHPRDKAIYHLALYCGLRNTGLRTLRIKDIDLESHEWYFNTQADGLKHINRPNEPRPLFQAERAVRDWLEMHPDPQPDHYLITGKPSASRKDPSQPMTRETIRYTMQQLKERTAERDDVMTVEKPCHPHMMRHNFVSMCRKHPDITDADIKFYIGHAPESDVMETTYSHLSSDEHNSAGHAAFGVSDAGDGTDDIPPWDSTCKRCDRVLHPGDDVCDECGTERGPTPWDDAPAEAGETYMERMERKMEEMFEEKVGDIMELPEAETSDPQERAKEIEEKLDRED